MNATENKKGKKRKNKKAVKSTSASSDLQTPMTNSTSQDVCSAVGDDGCCGGLPMHDTNPFLGGEVCLLCRCQRPASPNNLHQAEDQDEGESASLSALPLWVCPDCRKTVEEEERRAAESSAMLEHDLRLESGAPFIKFPEAELPNGSTCTCESCTERRQIQAQYEQETQELQQCWVELRHVVRCIYREAGTGLADSQQCDQQTTTLPDIQKMKDLVNRLCVRDSHQLYQRLESQGREYVIEMKVRLLKQLTSGHKTPPQAKQFVSMLLEEYGNLCTAAKTLASFLTELEQEHLKQFNLTWELHNKHLFQSIIYSDPVVQNSLPMLITQLRLGAASKEAYHEDTYPNILHRYLKFDDEMSVISVVWRDCQQLLEDYSEEQTALKAKQKMLKEDWEFFKAQRKLLKQQVHTKNKNSNQDDYDVMRQIYQGIKSNSDECHCPNCNRKRCPCDECTISHMITCGLISPDVTENIPHHHQGLQQVPGQPASFPQDPSQYIINVTPPSMSSTGSSSGSSSPVPVEHPRLALPFEDCPENFHLAEEVPEEHTNESKYDSGQGSDEEDDDDGDEYGDEDDDDDDDDEDDDDEDDDEEDDDDEYEDGEDEDQRVVDGQSSDGSTTVSQAGESASGKVIDTCDCMYCTPAKLQQAASQIQELQAVSTPCQCQTCVQQTMSSAAAVHASLSQPAASSPRPAALHLYPHIHGGQQGALGAHTRPPSIMQPHLYELHGHGAAGAKAVVNKHNFSLDLDSQQALHQHICHAFGDWENNYNAATDYTGLASELFNQPTPPLLNGNPYMPDANHVGAETPVSCQSLKATAALATHAAAGNKASLSQTVTSSGTLLATSGAAGAGEHVHTEACFKNRQPINRTLAQPSQKTSVAPFKGTLPTLTTASSGMQGVPPHNEHCLKHNPFLHTHHSSFSGTHGTSTVTSTAAAGQLPHSIKLPDPPNLNLAHQPHLPLTCSHQHGHPHGPPAPPPAAAAPPPGGACNDPECDGHHDDNYDSIDDSCSEKSSSTSASNQKDGKYCDCCYCEFFGHSNPPVAPTSRNYAEMRDRLRKRLKKKKEEKTVVAVPEAPPQKHCLKEDQRGLEELVKFINGKDEEAEREERERSTAKAAKRARQKQRKAEEKARREAEEQQRILEEQRRIAEQQQQLQQQRRKKTKHKNKAANTKEASPPTPCTRQEPCKQTSSQTSSSASCPQTQAPLSNGRSAHLSIRQKTTSQATSTPQPSANIADKKRPQPVGTNSPSSPPRPDKRKSKPAQSQPVQPPPTSNPLQPRVNGSGPKPATENVTCNNHVKANTKAVPKPAPQPAPVNQPKVTAQQPPLPAVTATNQAAPNVKKGSAKKLVPATPVPAPAPVDPAVLRQARPHQAQQVMVNGLQHPPMPTNQRGKKPREQAKSTSPDDRTCKTTESLTPSNRSKKNKRKNKTTDDLDEIFMPREDLDNGEIDEFEREIEEFKRFCLDSTPKAKREKVPVNMNLKDIFSKKKSGISCI